MSDLELRETLRDVEERLRACQAELDSLKAQHSQDTWYRRALESAPDGYVLFDQDFHPTFLNNTGARLYEQTHEVNPGQAETSAGSRVSGLEEALVRNVFTSGQPAMVEYKLTDAGQGTFIEARYIPQHAADGQVQAILCILRDDTGRKRVSEVMQINEQLVRAALSHARINVYTQDMDLCYNWIYDQQFGLLEKAYPGKTDQDFYREEEAQKLTRLKRQVLETGRGVREEIDLLLNDGSHSFELVIEPMKNAANEITGLLCSSLDTTERRKTALDLERLAQENQTQKFLLARHNELLKAIFDVDPSGLAVLVGDQLEHRFVNPAYRAMLPYPELDPIERPYAEVWPQAENFRGGWLMQRVMKTGNAVHFDRYPQQFPDGTTRHFGFNLQPMIWESQPAVLVVLWDVTTLEAAYQNAEQAAEEARLRAAEAQEGQEILNALLEYVPEGIAIANLEGQIRHISRFGKQMTVLPLEVNQGLATDLGQHGWQIYQPDGITPADPGRLPLNRATQTGEVIINEEWLLKRPGAEPHYVSCNAGPIRNRRGLITGGMITWQDITERKQAEAALERYAARLEASNQELDQFASVASHDLQEPLRKLQSFGQLLITQVETNELPETSLDIINRMVDASQRMQRMINDLLTFSRVSTKGNAPESIDVTKLVGDVLTDLEVRLHTTKGQIILGDLPSVYADPLQMRQLMQNLLSNALKYHRPDVHPVVNVYGQVIFDPNQSGKRMVQICVEDNGIGFDTRYLDRIFQPFERLHGRSEYEGTGMGLAICQKIVERHRGTITARSEPGSGATFIVTLPGDA